MYVRSSSNDNIAGRATRIRSGERDTVIGRRGARESRPLPRRRRDTAQGTGRRGRRGRALGGFARGSHSAAGNARVSRVYGRIKKRLINFNPPPGRC